MASTTPSPSPVLDGLHPQLWQRQLLGQAGEVHQPTGSRRCENQKGPNKKFQTLTLVQQTNNKQQNKKQTIQTRNNNKSKNKSKNKSTIKNWCNNRLVCLAVCALQVCQQHVFAISLQPFVLACQMPPKDLMASWHSSAFLAFLMSRLGFNWRCSPCYSFLDQQFDDTCGIHYHRSTGIQNKNKNKRILKGEQLKERKTTKSILRVAFLFFQNPGTNISPRWVLKSLRPDDLERLSAAPPVLAWLVALANSWQRKVSCNCWAKLQFLLLQHNLNLVHQKASWCRWFLRFRKHRKSKYYQSVSQSFGQLGTNKVLVSSLLLQQFLPLLREWFPSPLLRFLHSSQHLNSPSSSGWCQSISISNRVNHPTI